MILVAFHRPDLCYFNFIRIYPSNCPFLRVGQLLPNKRHFSHFFRPMKSQIAKLVTCWWCFMRRTGEVTMLWVATRTVRNLRTFGCSSSKELLTDLLMSTVCPRIAFAISFINDHRVSWYTISYYDIFGTDIYGHMVLIYYELSLTYTICFFMFGPRTHSPGNAVSRWRRPSRGR